MHHSNNNNNNNRALAVDRSDPLGHAGRSRAGQLLLPRVTMKMLARASAQVSSPREPEWQSDRHLTDTWLHPETQEETNWSPINI